MENNNFGRRDVLGMGAGLAATAVGGAAFAQAKRPATFNWTMHKPAEVGMSQAGLDGVKAAIQKHIDNKDITGAVTAIARKNKLVYFEAQGVSDVETGAPMKKDAIFRMMSSTKPTVGVAIMMLMEAGKLSIDDKVSRFIPEFSNMKVATAPAAIEAQMRDPAVLRDPAARARLAAQVTLVPASHDITIKDLMTHTSGLSSGGLGGLVNGNRRRPDDTLATYIPRLGSAALDFQPGTRWRYSASDGIDVLLRIVEITSGQLADVFLRERIHEPLDMRDTYFNVPAAKYDRILPLYSRQDGEWRPQRAAFGYSPTKYFSGAGGSMSTVHDYMQFEEMLLNKGELNGKRLIKPESVALMSRNHTGDLYRGTGGSTGGTGFGLTVRVLQDPDAAKSGRSAGSFGWAGAYGTTSWTDPTADLTAAMFIQQPIPGVLPDYEYAIKKALVA